MDSGPACEGTRRRKSLDGGDMRLINLAGRKYGRLTVLYKMPTNREKAMWLCRCECGNSRSVSGNNLRYGVTKSCGCLQPEMASKTHRKHGLSNSPEYRIWRGIIDRCVRQNSTVYRYYGGRGIKMCHRWRGSFLQFLADMGERPSTKHSVERIDNNGNYEPNNCRWATSAEQRRNSRNVRLIQHDGLLLCVPDWAKRIGISPSSLHGRLQAGWSVEEAVICPKSRR